VRAATTPPVISDPAVTVIGEAEAAGAEFIAHARGLDKLPPNHIEAMLMSAAAENLSWVAAGWAPPARGRYGPSGIALRDPEVPESTHLLLRRPGATHTRRSPVVGRVLPHITSVERCDGLSPIAEHALASGPYRIQPQMAGEAVVENPWFPVDEVLAGLPSFDGPPTALFLLPFLAVGGAERLLFELMAGLGGRYRLLIATTDPHLEAHGQTVDRARQLSPFVYTLGDWLPRDAVPSAIRHLIRRFRVASLVCWNGSVIFHDEVVPLRRRFPRLRIVNQLFNHEGGWIEHTTPASIRAIDAQIAVNTPIARALTADHGVPDDRVITIHHAVGPAAPRNDNRRARLRRELGVDETTMVVGTFVRMHSQKRPLDIIALARRMTNEKVHFFLVGGGPLDDAVNREIARNRPPNLTKWPLQADAGPLYDAIDLCLMTSEFEGLPVFLLDGLARGIPCVATAVGDIPLLLRDGGGSVVEQPGDLDGLAAALRPYHDLDHRRTEGEKGRRAVETRFGLDRYVAAYEAAIFRPSGDSSTRSRTPSLPSTQRLSP
jgi:glycosyltransferase involved in cell wall biosynthesis